MTLTIFNSTAEQNRLNKAQYLTQISTLTNCEYVEDTTILDPVFTVTNARELLTNGNYCFCSDTGRYYFITDKKIIAGNRIELHCHIDVLHTYHTQISGLQVTANRSTNKYNRYVIDNQQVCTAKLINQIKQFPSAPFNPNALTANSSKCFLITISA